MEPMTDNEEDDYAGRESGCCSNMSEMHVPFEKAMQHWVFTFIGVLFFCVIMQAAQLTVAANTLQHSIYVASVGALCEFIITYHYPGVQINPFLVIHQYLDDMLHGRVRARHSVLQFANMIIILMIGIVASAAALGVTHLKSGDYDKVGGPKVDPNSTRGEIRVAEAVATFIYGSIYMWGVAKLAHKECEDSVRDVTNEQGVQRVIAKCHLEKHMDLVWVAVCNAAGFFLACSYAFPVSGGSINIYRSGAAAIASGNYYGVWHAFTGHIIGFTCASILYFSYCFVSKRMHFGLTRFHHSLRSVDSRN